MMDLLGPPRRGFLLAAALVLLSRTAWTQAELDPPELVVTASRVAESPTKVPASTTVVTADDIASRGVRTVAEAIRLVPGVTVSDLGPESSQKAVSLRGSTTNEVLVLVDGVRVNNALSGLADLGGLTVENVERIEVVRDGASALFGGDAVGGVVQIITKKRPSPLRWGVENGGYLPSSRMIGYGTSKVKSEASPSSLVDSQKAWFSWAPLAGDVVFRTSGSLARATNAYTFTDANLERRQLQNAASWSPAGSLGATWPWAGGLVSADLAGSYSSSGVPGSQSSSTISAASEEDSKGRVSLRYSGDRFLTDALTLDATLHSEYTGIDYTDPNAPANDGHHKVITVGLDTQQTWTLSEKQSLVYGTSGTVTQAQSNTFGSPRRVSTGVFLEPVVEDGPWSWRPAVRYDYVSDFFVQAPLSGLGATLAVAYRLTDSDVVKTNLSRSYRVPSFEDLYWPTASGASGNPRLKPESSYSADLGWERRNGALTYRVVAFARYATDIILWQPGDDGVWRPTNYGAGLYPGVEQELTVQLGGPYALSVSHTLLYSYLLSDGVTWADDKRIPMVPIHTLGATIRSSGQPLEWSVSPRYTSLRYTSAANAASLASSFVADALVRWNFTPQSSAYFAVDNLFDEQVQSVQGYPLPGTRLRVGYEAQL